MLDYSFSQSAHSHFCIRCIVYTGPVVIDSADTDIYVTGRKVEFPDMHFISEIANFLIQGGIG